MISRAQLDEEISRQRKKPPIDVNALMDDMKALLCVEHGRFHKDDLLEVFASEGVPLTSDDVNLLLKGICENGIVKMNSRSHAC